MRLTEYRIFKMRFFFFRYLEYEVYHLASHFFFHETLLSYSEFHSLLPLISFIYFLPFVSLTTYLRYSVACLLLRFSQPVRLSLVLRLDTKRQLRHFAHSCTTRKIHPTSILFSLLIFLRDYLHLAKRADQ